MAEQTQQQQQKPGQGPKKKGSVVDKWKLKSWYKIVAPEIFDSKEIGQLVASDEASLPNRIIRTGLGELTGTMNQQTAYTILQFRVTEVKGKSVATKFIGHELAPGYIRTLARRRRSIITDVQDVKTRDGHDIRLKMMLITGSKFSEAVRHALRATMRADTKTLASEMDFQSLVQEVVFGKFSSRLFNKLKKIAPVRRIEVRKSEVKEVFSSA
jgi:small subunit ribosomal protein S3Ae